MQDDALEVIFSKQKPTLISEDISDNDQLQQVMLLAQLMKVKRNFDFYDEEKFGSMRGVEYIKNIANFYDIDLQEYSLEGLSIKKIFTPFILVDSNEKSWVLIKKGKHFWEINNKGKRAKKFLLNLENVKHIFYLMPEFKTDKIGLKDFLKLSFLYNSTVIRSMLFCMLMASILTPLISILMGYLVKVGIVDSDISLVSQTIVLLFVVMISVAIFHLLRSLLMLRFSIIMHYFVQSAFMKRLLNIPAYKFENYSSGDLTNRVQSTGILTNDLVNGHFIVLFSLVFSLSSLIVMFVYFPLIALIILGIYIIALALGILCLYFSYQYKLDAVNYDGAIDGFMNQVISGITSIKAFAKESIIFQKWQMKYANYRRNLYVSQIIGNIQLILFTAVHSIVILIFFWSFSHFYSPKSGDIQSFIVFSSASMQFGMSFMGLTGAFSSLLSILVHYQRLKPILEATADQQSDSNRMIKHHLKGQLSLVNLQFMYPNTNKPVLKNISLEIEPGDFIGIIGDSGSGKSTLIKVLIGMYPCSKQQILFDGYDLTKLNQGYLRKQIGVVLQDAKLIPGSILENLLGNSPHLTEDDAWQIIKKIGLYDIIMNLPMGIHTILNDDSEMIAKGEKQLIIIARALIDKPKILLLDEITGALDHVSQEKVMQCIGSLDVTRVLISHRYESLMLANKVYRVQAGELAHLR